MRTRPHLMVVRAKVLTASSKPSRISINESACTLYSGLKFFMTGLLHPVLTSCNSITYILPKHVSEKTPKKVLTFQGFLLSFTCLKFANHGENK